MKTSNYILFSFLIFFFGGISLLCFGSKYYKSFDDPTNFKIKEDKTAPFSVVVVEPEAYIVLLNGEEFKVSQRYLKEGVPNFAPYEVRNDTLFMYSVKQNNSNKQGKSEGGHFMIIPDVYCKNVKSIIAKEKNNIRLNNYHVDSLSVTLNQSEFNWENYNNKSTYLNIDSKNSYLYIAGEIEKISLKLDKTTTQINSSKGTKVLSGSLSNDSEFQGKMDGKANLDVDQSSRMIFSN